MARVAAFYERALGLAVLPRDADGTTLGRADGTPLLTVRARPDALPGNPRAPGLFHTAFLVPTRADLARWLTHAARLGLRLDGASDHLVSEAIYLADPEGNGIEVYVDRDRADWPRAGATEPGGVAMATLPLDAAALLGTVSGEVAGGWQFPAGGGVGHVHLRVGDLAAAEAFYRERLGMAVMARYPGAVFLSWGGYHHHIAVNVWGSRGAGPRAADKAGLATVMIRGVDLPPDGLTDPSGNRLIAA
jgi:catechol 2,3-dioxygenase